MSEFLGGILENNNILTLCNSSKFDDRMIAISLPFYVPLKNVCICANSSETEEILSTQTGLAKYFLSGI